MSDECPKCTPGLPPWLATFADMMSLLMCFFVLLLSFAEVDAIRFKKMAESMKDAFGVQQEIPANEIVKGVSVIKQEWSPSIAEESVISEIRQETSEQEKEHVQMNDGGADLNAEQIMSEAEQIIEQDLQQQKQELQESLEEEIKEGLVSVEKEGKKITIRIHEKGSFGSGSARLAPDFYEVMDRISAVLAQKPGRIVVSGHTDNVPINTGRFRSNWELSSARAVTVLHALLRNKQIDQNRVLVEGWADTQPLEPNDTPEHRAMNRRVELVLRRDDGQEKLGTVSVE